MPDIMLQCPVHAVAVSTGLSTDSVQFESLPDCSVPFQCHACNTIHYWRPRDAWVQGCGESRRRTMGGRDHSGANYTPALKFFTQYSFTCFTSASGSGT